MAKRWQKDADGILIFVRTGVCTHVNFCIIWNIVDWSILCRGRCPPFYYRPGPEAKQSGHLCILPGQHLSGSCRPERNTLIHPFPRRRTAPIHSSEIRRLGEFALVLEPSDEP